LPKDTLTNLREVPEFALQIVSRPLVDKMNLCSVETSSEVDEFQVAGLTAVPGSKISIPHVAEASAVMECRLREIIPVGEGPGSGALVLGEVLLFRVDDSLLVNGEVDIERLDPVGRLGGAEYSTVRDRFALDRPEPEALGLPQRDGKPA
jgi:flavin reductase (DIM6/NTAB) family NADH-FMN oxidoreductase RutF